jgi:apolipoprotein N-acyltransferase
LKTEKPYDALLVFLIFVAGWLYGYTRNIQIHRLLFESNKIIHAAGIQGNIGDIDKIASEQGLSVATKKVMDTYTSMTDQAMQLRPPPDFVVWPETSYPSTFGKPSSRADLALDTRMTEFSKTLNIPILFGGYDRIGRKDFNAFFLLNPDSELQVYRKNILLLFGEYIPGADQIEWIRRNFPQVGNFGRGIGPTTLEIHTRNPNMPTLKASPIICYEALFSNYVIESARMGSQLILNVTNDSWFGTWGEPQLHLALTVFRSIETRLSMLRTTNTGISTLILPDGEITQATTLNVGQVMNASIPLTEPIPTLMKAWGDWFGYFALTISLLSFTLSQMRHWRKRLSTRLTHF